MGLIHNNMISFRSRIYLGNDTWEMNKNLLLEFYDICKKYNYKLKITYGGIRPINKDSLNANAGIFKNQSIAISPEWMHQLIINENIENVRIALLGTLGHEISHKMGNIKGLRKFELWTNEVHCDFKGASLTLNGERKLLLKSIHNKIQLGRKNIDDKDCTHPSWRQRIEYASQYDYNEELIRKIAKDTKCSNEKRIQKVINQFDPIILK